MKTILIAIPTNKNIEVDTFKSIYDLFIPNGFKTEFQYFYGYQIDQIRNLIADWGKRYDYLFCVDSDMILPRDTLIKMVAADKDIISGMYIQRKPGQHILEIYLNKYGGIHNATLEELGYGVVPIAACGFGCVLIKNHVISNMSYPHFYYKSSIDFANTISEDVYFCEKARGLGFGIYVDTTIHCKHVGSNIFEVDAVAQELERVFQLDALEYEFVKYMENLDIKPRVIYDIGACVGHWTRHASRLWPEANIHTFDANTAVEPIHKRMGYPYHIGVLTDRDGRKVDFFTATNHYGGPSYYLEKTKDFHGITPDWKPNTQYGMTLDTIVIENGYPLPDLIKMDVQGAELDILRGSPACLHYVNDIFLEAQHVEYNEGAPKIDDITKFLNDNGFEMKSVINMNTVDGNYHFVKVA